MLTDSNDPGASIRALAMIRAAITADPGTWDALALPASPGEAARLTFALVTWAATFARDVAAGQDTDPVDFLDALLLAEAGP